MQGLATATIHKVGMRSHEGWENNLMSHMTPDQGGDEISKESSPKGKSCLGSMNTDHKASRIPNFDSTRSREESDWFTLARLFGNTNREDSHRDGEENVVRTGIGMENAHREQIGSGRVCLSNDADP